MHYMDIFFLWLTAMVVAIALAFWGYNTREENHHGEHHENYKERFYL